MVTDRTTGELEARTESLLRDAAVKTARLRAHTADLAAVLDELQALLVTRDDSGRPREDGRSD